MAGLVRSVAFAGTIGLAVVAGAAAARSEDLPLEKGMDIATARAALFKAGWEGIKREAAPDKESITGYVYFELGATEVVDCAGTGLAPCKFAYKNAEGKNLTVFTAGEEPVLQDWQFGLQ